MTGYMQPLGDGLEISAFMFVEHPIGCWYCEMPETISIIYVELPAGKSMALAAAAPARHGPIHRQRYRSGRFSVRYPRGARGGN